MALALINTQQQTPLITLADGTAVDGTAQTAFPLLASLASSWLLAGHSPCAGPLGSARPLAILQGLTLLSGILVPGLHLQGTSSGTLYFG
jgi:hypothetical protein